MIICSSIFLNQFIILQFKRMTCYIILQINGISIYFILKYLFSFYTHLTTFYNSDVRFS